jgi:anti-sigma-K factor RskA
VTPHDLAAAYAIDALDPEDLAVFSRHLDDCPSCQEQVSSIREAAAALGASGALSGMGAPGRGAPASLRASVLASVGSTPQVAATSPLAQQLPAPIAVARARRRIPVAWIGTAAAAVLAVALGIAIGGYVSSNPDGPALAAHEQAMRIISAPDAHTMSVALGRSSLVMSADYAGAVLMGDTTPMPAAGTEYQVWMGHADGTSAPGPTFMPDAAGTYMVLMSGNMGDVAKVFVTAEPMGGSPSPTGPMVAGVTLGK